MKLYAEEIGQRRLQELRLNVGYGISMSFNEKELGEYSIRRRPVLVVLTGARGSQQWVLMPCTKQNIKQHRGHCYLVKGKKVSKIQYHGFSGSVEKVMSAWESMDRTKSLCMADTDEIFRAGMGSRTRKKVTSKVREGGVVGSVVVTKRFSNSRLTCVCKTRKF